MCNALASFALLRRVGGHWEGKRCYMLRFLPVRVMAEMHLYSYSFCDSYSCSDRKHTLSACLFTSAGGGVGKRLHVIVLHIAVSRDILTISASTVIANARALFPGLTLILANERSPTELISPVLQHGM